MKAGVPPAAVTATAASAADCEGLERWRRECENNEQAVDMGGSTRPLPVMRALNAEGRVSMRADGGRG